MNSGRARSPSRKIPDVKGCAAILFLFGIAAAMFAQSLPRLGLNSSSNHQIVVTWPYINAGFSVQEAKALSPATNWQASTLAPAFDSNRVQFSVLAPATNNAKFFRLAAPADVRGIYVYAPLGGGPNNSADAMVTNAINVPGVDGLLIVGLWSDLETNFNHYDWSHLDKWMTYAATLNKKVNLSFAPVTAFPTGCISRRRMARARRGWISPSARRTARRQTASRTRMRFRGRRHFKPTGARCFPTWPRT